MPSPLPRKRRVILMVAITVGMAGVAALVLASGPAAHASVSSLLPPTGTTTTTSAASATGAEALGAYLDGLAGRGVQAQSVSTPVVFTMQAQGTTPNASTEGGLSGPGNMGTFLATCYDLRGPTKTGERAGPRSVAVDPAVIPLGSRIYIHGVGYRTADDTGGAIQGKHIDVWEPTSSDCAAFGRRHLNVHLAS